MFQNIALIAFFLNFNLNFYLSNPIEINANVCTTKACMNAGTLLFILIINIRSIFLFL
jgi:hypothetical protein